MMKISQKGLDLIKKWEGFRASPYLDTSGIATIGYGNTFYPNGKKVTLSDAPITKQQAEILLKEVVKQFESVVNKSVTTNITQNQFDALVSLCYNIGAGNFQRSTLLKIVNQNPNDDKIYDEFLKFVFSKGKKLQGLENRRKDEILLYGLKKK